MRKVQTEYILDLISSIDSTDLTDERDVDSLARAVSLLEFYLMEENL